MTEPPLERLAVRRFLEAVESLDISATEIAEALWLAPYLSPAGEHADQAGLADPGLRMSDGPASLTSGPPGPTEEEPLPGGAPARAGPGLQHGAVAVTIAEPGRVSGPTIRVPGVPALPRVLEMSRALRPLKRTRRPLRSSYQLDEEATAVLSAETRSIMPVMRPAPARWLDLALVVDGGPSMTLWRDLAAEFRTLLEMQGAFRNVRLLQLGGIGEAGYELRAGRGGPAVSPQQLVDTTGRRLVVLLTDCIADGWRDGSMDQMLRLWAESMPVALAHTLPATLWSRTGVQFQPVRLAAARPGLPNALLTATGEVLARAEQGSIPIPVLELEARWLAPWANLVAGTADRGVPGMALFVVASPDDEQRSSYVSDIDPADVPPAELVRRFRGSASPEAFRLAASLSVVPLTLPVMRLVMQSVLVAPRPSLLAEVFLGGLLIRASPEQESQDPDTVLYDFRPGVREVLLGNLRRTETMRLLDLVSEVIAGQPISAFDFNAVIGEPDALGQSPFATLSSAVLRRLGGRYAEIADQLEWQSNAATALVLATIPEPSAVADELTGQGALLEEVRERFLGGTRVQVLHGPGGIGKTAAAAAFMSAADARYAVQGWIPAGSASAMRTALSELAEALGVPPSAETSRSARQVLEALRYAPPENRCLLVFDGAPSVAAVTELLPAECGDILITCREAPPPGISGLLVPALPRADSIELLRRGGMSPTTAGQLAAELNDHPLALSLVAALGERTGWGGTRILERLPAADDPGDRAALLILEWLARVAPAQLAAVHLYAALGPAPIPPALAGDEGGEIVSWGLATADPAGLMLAPSVRELLLRRWAPAELQQAQQLAWLALSHADPADRAAREALLPHLLHLAVQARTPEYDPVIVAGMRSALTDGEAQGARDLADALFDRRDRPAADVTLTAATDCGREGTWLLGRLGDVAYPGAERLAALKATRSIADPLILAALEGDVLGRRLAGDFNGARQLTEETLQLVEQAYPAGHALKLTWAAQAAVDQRLAGAFVRAGELDKTGRNPSRPSGRRALKASVALALDMSGAGAHADALALLLEAQAELESLGERLEEESLAVRHARAVELRWTGALTEARKLAAEVVIEGQALLGQCQLTTLIAAAHLAQCLRLDRRPHDGLELGAQTLDGFRSTLGSGHPLTLAAQAGTAVLYRAAGQLRPASALGTEALRGLRASLGDGHPFTLCCLAGQACQRAAEGKHDAARKLWAKALAGFDALWGPGHPCRQLTASNQAREDGNPPDELFSDLLPIR